MKINIFKYVFLYVCKFLCFCEGHDDFYQVFEGDRCVTDDNEVGNCVQLYKCLSTMSWLTKGLRPLQMCQSTYQNPIVCCVEHRKNHGHGHGSYFGNGRGTYSSNGYGTYPISGSETYSSGHGSYYGNSHGIYNENGHGSYHRNGYNTYHSADDTTYNTAYESDYDSSYQPQYNHGYVTKPRPVYGPPPGSRQGPFLVPDQESFPDLYQEIYPASNQKNVPDFNQGIYPDTNQGILPDSYQGTSPSPNQGTSPDLDPETYPDFNVGNFTGPDQGMYSNSSFETLPDNYQETYLDSDLGSLPDSDKGTYPDITPSSFPGFNGGNFPRAGSGVSRNGADGTGQSNRGPPIDYGSQSDTPTGAFSQASSDSSAGRKAEEKCQEFLDTLPYPIDVRPSIIPTRRSPRTIFRNFRRRFTQKATENSTKPTKDTMYEKVTKDIKDTNDTKGINDTKDAKDTVDSVRPFAAIGGVDAKRMEFPHMALLGYGTTFETAEWLCGGSVISERFILTAGHCISTTKSRVTFVALGILKRSDPQSLWEKYTVKRIIPHPEYRAPSKYNDIALLETTENITFSASVLPACLNPGNVNDLVAYATGWGTLGYRAALADTLQTVTVNRFPNQTCLQQFSGDRNLANGFDPVSQMCFGDMKEIKDTCPGDSGGPLQVRSPLSSVAHLIIGVTSFGDACGFLGSAGVYTRVSHYLPWIVRVVWGNNQTK